MPTFDYADMAQTAAELIAEFGFATQLRRPGTITGPAHNPTKGAPVVDGVTICRAKLKVNEADGTRIKITDAKFLLSPTGPTADPSTDSELWVDGKWRKLSAVEPVNPGDVNVYWKLYAA